MRRRSTIGRRRFGGERVVCALLAALVAAVACPARSDQHATEPQASPAVTTIANRADFDRLARVQPAGSGIQMPLVLFVVDRASENAMSYVDSKRFRFHRDYLNATYQSLEKGDAFYEKNYSNPDRRFILGIVVYQQPLGRYSFELNESDKVSPEILQLAATRLRETFFAPLLYKANTAQQADVAKQIAGLETIRADEVFKSSSYLALNTGTSFGVLRLLDQITPDTVIDRNEIVILTDPPVTITPVSGIIYTQPPSPLAHLNVLARSWGVPNIYAKAAADTYRGLLGKYVRLTARPDGYEIRLADSAELVEVQRREIQRSQQVTPTADLTYERLTSLSAQRAADSVRFGAKSANLGEVIAARIPGMSVPAGFTIPFSWYDKFIRERGIENDIYDMLDDQRFNHDVIYRRARLAALRDRIVKTPIPAAMSAELISRKHRELGAAGVFVRSSTNSEDLRGFSGAGLYTTVPNVQGDDELLVAVRTVWASIWNDRAYEARAAAGISQIVYPAVLIQQGMNSESSGVLITSNPFNPDDPNAVYINAKRGLGIRVVDGYKVAEQILFNPANASLRILTRSADDTALTFSPTGGIREVRVETGRAVLTDDLIRRLSRVAAQLERHFGVGTLDIEWLTIGDRIYVVQARPYAGTSSSS